MPLPLRSHVYSRHLNPSRGRPSRRFSGPLLATCLALATVCAACGAVGSSPAQPAATVSVQPNSAQVFVGGKTHFSAVVQNASDSAVIWAIQQAGGSQDLGTIDSSGTYIAPNALQAPESVTVIASLQTDPDVNGSAIVSVQSSLAIFPTRAAVTTSQALPLTIATQGVGGADVTWLVDGIAGGSASVGTVSATASSATYTPPPAAGVHAIAASLNSSPNVTGQTTVYVTDFAGTFTWRNDNARSGINNQELALAPATVSSSMFGKLFSCRVDGYVYAQPLYVANLAVPGNGTRNVVFVTTENDSVYAFDADASPCQVLWQKNLAPAGQQAVFAPDLLNIKDPAIGPLVGVTGTPVIGTGATPYLYAVAATQTIPAQSGPNYTPPTYDYWLWALNLATGQPAPRLNGIEVGTTTQQGPAFAAGTESQRAALLLENGIVYVAFGSYNRESPEYFGWLLGYDSTSATPAGAFHVVANPPGGGIWQSGGGPSADANGNIFVATGDGHPNSGLSYSDSVLRLKALGEFSVADYFTPCDQPTLGAIAPDPAKSQSSAPLLLSDSAGSPSAPHLLISGSKEGFLYVIDRDAMGGFSAPCPDAPPRVQAVSVDGPIFSTPLFWNSVVYVAPGQKISSQTNSLMALPMSQGILSPLPPALAAHETLGPQGATPVISANATAGAVLWLIDTSGAFATPNNDGPAILRAYDPSDLSNELYDSTRNPHDAAGPAVKFTVPTVANGKVYVGTQTELDVYGLLP